MVSKNFLFGAATAAYQAEGVLDQNHWGKNLWDDYLRKQNKFDPKGASDFYHRYPSDLKMGHAYGMNAIRISISWARIFPDNGEEISEAGIAYYDNLINECLKNDVEPIVTLHHFDSPLWLFNIGDFVNRIAIDYFVKYAQVCFDKFGDRVKKWVTFNETYVYGSDKFIVGEAPPCEKYQLGKAIQQMYNMMVAHARVVNIYKSLKSHFEIGIVHVLQPKYPFDKNKTLDCTASKRAAVLFSRQLLDCNYKGGWTESTKTIMYELLSIYDYQLITESSDDVDFQMAQNKTDFLGVNYYSPSWYAGGDAKNNIVHNGTGQKGTSLFSIKGIGTSQTPPSVPCNDWDWPIYPDGLYDILQWIANEYPNYRSIYITENGIGFKEKLDLESKIFDLERVDYLSSHFKATERAIENGINVIGFFVWSWMDVFSWTNGYEKRYGLFYVDYSTQCRYPKLSALWYSKLIEERSANFIDVKNITTQYQAMKLATNKHEKK